MDQIKKLDEQKAQLLHGAKQEAIALANQGIKALNELGFNYRLVSEDTVAQRTGTRRTGIRDEVLSMVKANPGITRSTLLDKMNARGDKSAEQSISNALAALKKAGTITADGGAYKA